MQPRRVAPDGDRREQRPVVRRRRALAVLGGALAALAGCSTRAGDPAGGEGTPTDEPTGTPGARGTPTGTGGTGPDPTPTDGGPGDDETSSDEAPAWDDLPEWDPEWTLAFDGVRPVGVDAADGTVFATLNAEDGPSAVAAVDPGDRTARWRTDLDGEAVGGSFVAYRRIARGQWGVTLPGGGGAAGETVYAVAGRAESYDWTELHALDRATGDRRWSLRRERELAVAGVADGLLVATGLEFFEPEHSHDAPEEPLTTVVYGLDAADGTVRWTAGFRDVADVAVGTEGVYVAAGERLIGLGRDGSRRWTVERDRTVDPAPARWVEVAPDADRIYYLAGEDRGAILYGISPGGDRDWSRDLPVEELLLDGDDLLVGGDAVARVRPDGSVAWRDAAYGQWLLLDPDGDTLYTRAEPRADAATAYAAAGGEERWTFDPPSNNAWPEAATADALVATAITGGGADEPFNTVYAVDADGRATAARGIDHVFDAAGLDGLAYVVGGGGRLLAMDPRP